MEKELVLTFPMAQTTVTKVRGRSMVQCRTKMTAEEFIGYLLRYTVSGDEVAAVIERRREENE